MSPSHSVTFIDATYSHINFVVHMPYLHRPPHLYAGDADLTERGVRDVGSLVPRYAINLILFASIYLIIIYGACPSASPKHELTFTFLRTHVKISFMSMFARFMYVFSTRYTTGSWNQ